jgi:hypothetical protein
MLPSKQTHYHAFLLRLWRAEVTSTGSPFWRASLENPHTGERLGFATLEQLFAYLLELSEAAEQPAAISDNAEDEP